MSVLRAAFGVWAAGSAIGWAACSPFDSAAAETPDAGAQMSDGAASNVDASGVADGSATTYRDLVLEDRPRLYLRLGEPAGVGAAVNEVAGGSAASYGAVSSAAGAIANDPNTAAAFGNGSLVTIASLPDFSGQQQFTIEAWVKPSSVLTNPNDYAHLLSSVRFDTIAKRQGYALFIGNSGYGFGIERFVDETNVKAIVQAAPPLTRFSHVVGTYDGTMLTLYIDGYPGPSSTDTRLLKGASPPLAGFLGGVSSANRDFTGVLDEVALYDRALTPERVLAHYTKGTTGH
jgi:hypothetical protein